MQKILVILSALTLIAFVGGCQSSDAAPADNNAPVATSGGTPDPVQNTPAPPTGSQSPDVGSTADTEAAVNPNAKPPSGN